MIENPLRKVYDLQDLHSQDRTFPKYPLYIDVEPSSFCNMNCLFCLRNQIKREQENMGIEFFKQIISDCVDMECKAIRLIGWGEPLMNPVIFDMVKIINENKMVSHITTNGLLLTEDRFDELFNSGLQSIYFSMQGLTEIEYNKLRNTDKYFLLFRNIVNLVNERKKRNLKYPYIQINTFVTDEKDDEKLEFIKYWSDKVDGISISGLWLERLEDKVNVNEWVQRCPKYPKDFICNEVRAKLTIYADGVVVPCCEDINRIFNLGNILDCSLGYIWNSLKAIKIREFLNVKGNQGMFTLCSKCELCNIRRGIV
jgi:radical SAM protein with 4Fe4S-binding SPASM domain